MQMAPCVKFHENPPGGIRAFPSVTTDRYDEVNSARSRSGSPKRRFTVQMLLATLFGLIV
jgi:hypothetical protein